MIKSTLKIARCCRLVIHGFSNFLGLFQVIMANPDHGISRWEVGRDFPCHAERMWSSRWRRRDYHRWKLGDVSNSKKKVVEMRGGEMFVGWMGTLLGTNISPFKVILSRWFAFFPGGICDRSLEDNGSLKTNTWTRIPPKMGCFFRCDFWDVVQPHLWGGKNLLVGFKLGFPAFSDIKSTKNRLFSWWTTGIAIQSMEMFVAPKTLMVNVWWSKKGRNIPQRFKGLIFVEFAELKYGLVPVSPVSLLVP